MSHRKPKPIEGDLIEDINSVIFDVKGLVHPPNKAIAFPRFFPDSSGDRTHEGTAYKKVYALSERFKFLEKHFPQYIIYDSVFDEKLCEIPLNNVKRYYNPIDHLKELHHSDRLDKLEIDALEFVQLLQNHTRTSWNKMGISGSLLIKMHTPSSDIDPIIYGARNCHKTLEALRMLQEDTASFVKPYSVEEMRALFSFRFQDTRTTFEDFVRTESRKVLQGKFKDKDYFFRLLKASNEIQEEYGKVRYRNVGYAGIKAEIEDDSGAIFTPCSYKVRNVKVLEGKHFLVEEIASFRGRFCEQARDGEAVFAQGKIEKVEDNVRNREYYRLLLGNKPSDYMILA